MRTHPPAPAAERHRALASPARLRLVDELRATPDQDAADLADRLGLHVNTVRTHLRVLEDAGLIAGAQEVRTRPGRPRLLYRLRDDADAADGTDAAGYRMLATMLSGLIDSAVDDVRGAAEDAGRAWGAWMVDRPAPFTRVDVDDAVTQLRAMLDELGFAPGVDHQQGDVLLDLRRCPFGDVARAHPDVVCSLHLGLLRGALDTSGAALDAITLEPWVEPSVCRATLRPAVVG